ncbi:MAG: bifunctional 5,10-methylene-tetrahydrofolate dehydrogenase/5,10-methylene-tetrahydrofolate cyclohydrolase [Chloroflexi bacterium]|mgnify:CR=1 FL=1|nr:bifunctional 5,10-methylene-tetrahydrofolate dehydrogenase/5,10-methylene-tetrahydrofolate cyclohydrolase [Chloroflexota bacterium]|tara:strand:+ start:7210 stop:8091 length:882 start_codon:yes stop_codon:yes gene_type:complete
MNSYILDGNAVAAEIRSEVKHGVEQIVRDGLCPPHLRVIMIGSNTASQTYVRLKMQDCEEVGISSSLSVLNDSITMNEVMDLIDDVNNNDEINAVIIQKPLPSHLDSELLDSSLSPSKDVDGLHPVNLGLLLQGNPRFIPATPLAVRELLVRSNIDIVGKNIVVIGRSNLVGKPLALILAQKNIYGNATVTIAHTGTKNLRAITLEADIIIAATGYPNTVTADMVRSGAIVVDVGINRINDSSRKRGYRLIGDVDFENVKTVAGAITPVPGGVGPITRAMLLKNTLDTIKANY